MNFWEEDIHVQFWRLPEMFQTTVSCSQYPVLQVKCLWPIQKIEGFHLISSYAIPERLMVHHLRQNSPDRHCSSRYGVTQLSPDVHVWYETRELPSGKNLLSQLRLCLHPFRSVNYCGTNNTHIFLRLTWFSM